MKLKVFSTIISLSVCLCSYAQTDSTRVEDNHKNDSVSTVSSDSIFAISSDAELLKDLAPMDTIAGKDSAALRAGGKEAREIVTTKRDWATWVPDPQRALWLALVIPGGGQIYNRKYWKLPIVYGGFLGCAYALTWNNMMYKDYSQAYLDIMDDDPGTASFNKFLHLGRQINESNVERYKTIFKKRKDRYRRWRDMSFFVMVGIYALSVIDAYVDAELSVFDISKDLSLRVQPEVMGNPVAANVVKGSSLGLNCSLRF